MGILRLFRRRDPGDPARRTPEITAAELARWLDEGRSVQLLDLRDASAFDEGHLPGAIRAPADRLRETAVALDRGAATVVY